jgi:hypothetical protein
LNEQFSNHRIYEKIDKMYKLVENKGGETENKEALINELNILDKLITELMLYAERKCCKRKERALWSPALQQSNLRIQYWNVVTKSKRQGIRSDHRLNHIKGRMTTEIRQEINSTNISPKAALKQAILKHKELLKDSQKLRREYLQSIIDDLPESENKNKTTLKSLMYREESNYDFRIIRSVYKGQKSNGVTHLEVPASEPGSEWKIITDPIIIEWNIIDRNIQHFGQSKDTPFATGNLYNIYGYQGTNKNSEQLILNQQLPTNLCKEDVYTQAIVKELADGNNLKAIEGNITFEEFDMAMKKWNERTTISQWQAFGSLQDTTTNTLLRRQ